VRVRQLVRTGALIVSAQATVAVIGIVALRVYTELVSPAVFGESNLVLSALGLGLQLFVAGFTAALLRFYSESATREAGDEFARATLHWALRAVALLIALMLIAWWIGRMAGAFSFTAWELVLGIAWLLAMTLRNVLMSRIQAQRRQAAYARLQMLEALLLFGVTLGTLEVVPSVAAFLTGQTLAVVCVVFLIVTMDPTNRAVLAWGGASTARFDRKAMSYGAPFAPLSFLSWLANLGDRYTLAALLGSGAAGRYVAPFSIASRGMLLANAGLCDLFRPILFDAENRHDDAAARQAFTHWVWGSVAVSAAGLAIIYLAGSLIASVLLAPGYRDGAVQIMLWVSVGYAVSGITQIVECRLLSLGHSARLLLPMILGALANVLFSIVLVRRFGIVGAAQATCASFCFQNAATTGFLLHALRRRRGHHPREIEVEPT
jgi:O-antigen/teichoic acid export membrane protein